MFRAIATVGGWTMVSRVLGFLRDMLIASRLGAGPRNGVVAESTVNGGVGAVSIGRKRSTAPESVSTWSARSRATP